MKKIILYITILLLAIPYLASSQVATLQTLDGTYGSMQVNVNMTGFTVGNSVGAITMKIGFDPNVASFTGITYNQIAGGINANAVGNEIIIAWSTTPAVPIDGIAFKLNFIYTGGSCNLTFNEGCEIAGALGGIIQTTYLNGAINQPGLSTTAVIGTQLGNYSIVNELPVSFSDFPTSPASSKVGAINLNMSYDVNKLQFVGISGLSGANANATGGIITIAWSNVTPIDLNTLNLKLRFNYLGGTSNVNFTGTNIISNANGVQIPVSFTNGQITQPSTSALVDIGDAVGQLSGNTSVPVTFSGFPINQGSLTMNIAYNNSALNFIGVSGLSGLSANASNGIIHLAWSNSGGVNIPGFNLLFSYIGGTSNLEFTGLNEITNNTAVVIPVTYTNGTVTQPPTPVVVSLGNTNLTPGSSTVLIPINFTGITGSINSATMYVNFDQTKLTYNGATGAPATPSGLVVNQDPSTKTIIITWANSTNSLADGKFLDLNFTFTGGTGNYDVPVYFSTFNANASSLSDDLSYTVLADWVNGYVNAMRIISGTLKYNSDPNPRIPLIGFKVKLKSGGITVDSTLTDVNGYYEFMAPNGTYTLESSAPPAANYYSDGDDAWAIIYYSFGYDYPYSNDLRILAGDVNQDGVTDDVDAWAVVYRAFGLSYPGYEFTAPDFLFENPTVIVNFADMLNQDILGICSGNVLGSNPNPNP